MKKIQMTSKKDTNDSLVPTPRPLRIEEGYQEVLSGPAVARAPSTLSAAR
jgi:hypothetical protein